MRVNTASVGDAARVARGLSFATLPVHLLTFSYSVNRIIENAQVHVCGKSISGKQFIQVSQDLYVPSPTLALMQLAASTDELTVLHYCLAFCGNFALDPDQEVGFVQVEPLITVRQLERNLKRLGTLDGVGKLRKLLPYVLENAYSPKESLLAMALTLPHKFGGYHLARPRLNHQIPIKKKAGKIANAQYYVADMFWPESNLLVEYDSHFAHLSPEQKTYDEVRRNTLERQGYKLISVTGLQLASVDAMDKVASEVARILGCGLRPRIRNFRERQETLLHFKAF